MGLDEFYNQMPQALSFAAVFVSVILLFYGFRNYNAAPVRDVGNLLVYTIPSLWMMLLAIYLWMLGKEDGHEK